MKFPPQYVENERILSLSHDLEILKSAFELIPVAEDVRIHLRRQSVLKSSLFSARIEGNPLSMEDVQFGSGNDTPDIHTKEILNIEKALGVINSRKDTLVTIDFVKELHKIVMAGISPSAGLLRTEDSAIFNKAGIAVYMTPSPRDVPSLLTELLHFIDTSHTVGAVKAGIAHIWFEKIHPFDDGNGRVGRLITANILSTSGYDFGGIVPFEEYLDSQRQEYYDALAPDSQDTTGFVEFFLEAMVAQARLTLEMLKHPPEKMYLELLPRRAEIVSIIRDHKLVTFDFLARRFRSIPAPTLHYDVQVLIKKGYIVKRGTTRGVLYTLKHT